MSALYVHMSFIIYIFHFLFCIQFFIFFFAFSKKMFNWRHLNNLATASSTLSLVLLHVVVVIVVVFLIAAVALTVVVVVAVARLQWFVAAVVSQNKDDPVRKNRTSARLNAKGHEKNTT